MYINESLGTFILTSGDGMTLTTELKKHKKTNTMRTLQRVCLTGSTAAGDMQIEISKDGKQGKKVLATVWNTKTATHMGRDEWLPVAERIYPGEELVLTCLDAAEAACRIQMVIKTHPRRRRRRR